MDNEVLFESFDSALLDVVEGERKIARLRLLIGDMRRQGRCTKEAEIQLNQLEASQALCTFRCSNLRREVALVSGRDAQFASAFGRQQTTRVLQVGLTTKD